MEIRSLRVCLLVGVCVLALNGAACALDVQPNQRVRQYVTVRALPSYRSTERARLQVGEHAELLGSQDGWHRVRLADGTEGYVLQSYTKTVRGEAAGAPGGPRPHPPAPLAQPGTAPWVSSIPTITPESREMNVHVIDVGQGASTLYEFPCGAILIDTGSEENEQFSGQANLIAYLDRFFAGRPDLESRLSLLLLTHPHVDHTHNAQAVIERYKPKNLVDDSLQVGSGKQGQIFLEEYAQDHDVPYVGVKLSEIQSGAGMGGEVIDPIRCANIDPTIRVLFGGLRQGAHCLPGWTQTDCKNGNNNSVVTRIDFGNFSTLNIGDLEETGIDELRSRSEALGLLDVDLYHVGHHGSRNGTTGELVTAMSPKMAVISTGDKERELPWSAWAYGHPNRVALNFLVAGDGVSMERPPKRVSVGVKGGTSPEWTEWTLERAVYATGWDGTIVIHADDSGRCQVFTEK